MIARSRRLLLQVVLVAAGLAACGYHFAVGRPIGGKVAAVHAPIFRNLTAEVGADALFTTAFRDELARQGLLSDAAADGVAEGELRDLRAGPSVAYPSDGGVSLATNRVDATVHIAVRQGERIVAQVDVSGGEDYLPASDVLGSEAARRAAVQRLAEALMRDAVKRLRSGL